jgi:superfamily II DNA/RNA helicase
MARTGSGKTAAFVIPMLQVSSVVTSPTGREGGVQLLKGHTLQLSGGGVLWQARAERQHL